MITLSVLILLTTGVFIFGLVLQNLTKLKFCSVCIAISSTWLVLLILRSFGVPVNPVLVGVLMGESVVGVYYLLEKRVPLSWHVFRWPYIITSTVTVLWVVGVNSGLSLAVFMLLALWIAGGVIFAYRENIYFKKITERLLACCRDW